MTNLTKLKAQILTLPRGKDGRIQFTNEFRKDACALVSKEGLSIAEASRRLGVNYRNIWKWMNGYTSDKYDTKGISVSRMRSSTPVETLEAKRNELLAEMNKISTALKLLKELGL